MLIKIIVPILFATSLSAQFDTTISKDEYYELTYQLEQSRIQNKLLKERIVEINWLVEANTILLNLYQERLHALEVILPTREKKKKKK